jgi:CBS domain-containing protein
VQLSEIMTAGVITSEPQAAAASVAQQMRDHRVGSVVLVDQGEAPVAMVTDRDLAVRVFAEGVAADAAIGEYASRPLVCGEPEMELEEAAALMVQHRDRQPRGRPADDRRGDRGGAAPVLLPRAGLSVGKQATLAWEARWARPVGLATLLAVALLIASVIAIASIGGGGEAESLRSVHDHSSSVSLSGGLQAAAFLLLVAPLVYLFKAAAARAPQMRRQFLGLVIAAPIFLCVASLLNVAAANNAASDFAAGKSTTSLSVKEATRECESDRKEDAAGFKDEYGTSLGRCAKTKREDDKAQNAIHDASPRSLAEALHIGGGLALAFALVYSCLYAMRVGLLSRFWGSLGIALGVAAALGLFQFTLLWFIYFGLLACGWIPRGRPPAWAAGEAVPWPSPGEAAAQKLEGPEGETEAQAIPEPDIPQLPEGADEVADPVERPKKRKRRDSDEPGEG